MTEETKVKKKKGKKLWIILLIIVVGVIIAITSGGGEADEEVAATPVDVAVLIDAYDNNEVSADEQYEDVYVQITGEVQSIGKDLTDTTYITFDKGGDFETNAIQCFFESDDEIAKVAKLSEGDTVTVEGTCDGLSIFNVLIKDCIIVE